VTTPLDHAARIAAWLAATDIDALELTGAAGHLRLRRGGRPAVTPDEPASDGIGEVPAVEAGHDAVPSPGFGLFLHAHPLHEAALVRAGERVTAGQVLGFLRIGALLEPVRAPRDGVVSAVLAPDGSLVGYGDPLFELSPQP
jgi:acetyl-CoA carboxylase biotin carboxyl carrier protein